MKYTVLLRNVNGKLRHSATMLLMEKSESKLAMSGFRVKALSLCYYYNYLYYGHENTPYSPFFLTDSMLSYA